MSIDVKKLSFRVFLLAMFFRTLRKGTRLLFRCEKQCSLLESEDLPRYSDFRPILFRIPLNQKFRRERVITEAQAVEDISIDLP